MRVPVRVRLTIAFAVMMAAVLGAAALFVHDRVESSLDRGIDNGLRARAADVGALAQQSDTGLREAQGARVGARRPAFAQILDQHGRILDATRGLAAPPLLAGAQLEAVRRGARPTIDTRLAGGAPVRLLAQQIRGQDQSLVVVVGQSLADRNRALDDLTGVLAIGAPVVLVLACLTAYLLTGAALRPVEALRRRAAALSADDLDGRLPPAGGNDELGRLGRTLNEMLARVQGSVARERTFVADASHELRTPLAMLRTELELIERDRPSGVDLQRAARSAIEETDRLTRMADDLLLLARADQGHAPLSTGTYEAADLLDEAARRAGRRVSGPRLEIAVNAPADAHVVADRDRVAQALDNLVDNAMRHAAERIELAARARGARVELHVRDDGPGFPDDFLPHAWERFARADAGRTEEGAGLGLAIVRTVAQLHGGATGAVNRPDGGADVWIALPRAPHEPRSDAGPRLPTASALR